MASCVLSEVRGLVKLRCSEDKRKRGDTREHKRVLGGVTVPYGTRVGGMWEVFTHKGTLVYSTVFGWSGVRCVLWLFLLGRECINIYF